MLSRCSEGLLLGSHAFPGGLPCATRARMANANPIPTKKPAGVPSGTRSRDAYRQQLTGELVFAVVGHLGSGTSTVAEALRAELQTSGSDAHIVKASDLILDWAKKEGVEPEVTDKESIGYVTSLQNLGDEMRKREEDYAAVAIAAVSRFRQIRAEQTGVELDPDKPVLPDEKSRAYILDSLRHPFEVEILRRLYGAAFAVVGVVCDESVREARLLDKFKKDASKNRIEEIMDRDAKDEPEWGQRVSDAFHLSDYYIDNTLERLVTIDGDERENPEWDIPEQLGRLIQIVTHSSIVRPRIDESAMYEAHTAALRSACLSRQVGACLLDRNGNTIATGTNEVPRAGGGVYGEKYWIDVRNSEDGVDKHDVRCAYRKGSVPYCSNTREQNEIIDSLIREIPELSKAGDIESLKKRLRKSRIGGLLEFSRAVHAEMESLLSAARSGVSTVGSRMFVTTYPCHYCARHIVSAGVDEVQYIEPYPKSQAMKLHRDAITNKVSQWVPPSKQNGSGHVLVRAFVGVAPRYYAKAFLKDRELKDKSTGSLQIGSPEWGSPWAIGKLNPSELELYLEKGGASPKTDKPGTGKTLRVVEEPKS